MPHKPKTGGQCRHCGHAPMHAAIVSNTGGNVHYAWCPKCSAQGPRATSADAALALCSTTPGSLGPTVEPINEECRCNACQREPAVLVVRAQRAGTALCRPCAAKLVFEITHFFAQ